MIKPLYIIGADGYKVQGGHNVLEKCESDICCVLTAGVVCAGEREFFDWTAFHAPAAIKKQYRWAA